MICPFSGKRLRNEPNKSSRCWPNITPMRTCATFGYKLRTGGVTADAFPTSAQISEALVTPATHQLPIKFTAGLHHPIRQFRDEVKTKMHGFLNVLGAAVLAAEHRWDANQTAIMLEDENADSFSFTDDLFAWREWKIDIERLKYRRKFVTSFGSCSFDEPREDLRALGFLYSHDVGRQRSRKSPGAQTKVLLVSFVSKRPTIDMPLKSFIEVPPDSHFPIQNLPFGIFQPRRVKRAWELPSAI